VVPGWGSFSVPCFLVASRHQCFFSFLLSYDKAREESRWWKVAMWCYVRSTFVPERNGEQAAPPGAGQCSTRIARLAIAMRLDIEARFNSLVYFSHLQFGRFRLRFDTASDGQMSIG